MKKLGILTGGGDAPGLNAVIRAAVQTALNVYDCEVFGIRNGYDGFLEDDGIVPLGMEEVRGILPRGGTIRVWLKVSGIIVYAGNELCRA